jgi:sugar phosphate isomerase/epimerase
MKLMGIGDEAGDAIESQLAATLELGWNHIEPRTVLVREFPKANLHDIPDEAFDLVARKLDLAGVKIYCFGSAIMNWSKRIGDAFEPTLAEVKRAIPRMQRTGSKFVRIMSYKPEEEDYRIPPEVFRRVKEVTNRFLDAGIQPVHENCMNYGGMSWQHALELLDKCPGLKWVFDTGNPIFNPDRSRPKPWPKQDPWEFWINVREHVAHIHVKDVVQDGTTGKERYVFPDEGLARVQDVLKDLVARGYAGGISIEPHMVAVFHDAQNEPVNKDARKRKNFVEYGRRIEDLIAGIRR